MDTALPSPVLLLTNQLHTGGAERYVVAVSRWLARHGVDTVVAAHPGELVDDLDDGVIYHPVDLVDVRLRLPLAVARVARIVRRHQPRILVANSLATAWIARLAAPGRPVVAVAHGWPHERYRLVSRPLAVADRVVAVSEDVRRRLVGGGLAPGRITVVPNGIDLTPFGPRTPAQVARAREALGAGPDDVVAISVGRFTPQKAQHRLVEVARRLAPSHPHLRWVLVGWGEREQELRTLVAEAGLAPRFRLLVRRSDVPDLLLASDLYVSASDWEGMPLSMIEAMAAGLPLVATDVEGVAALVDETNGARVAPGDVAALADAVSALADDEPRRLTLGSEGRRRAEQRHGLDGMAAQLGEVLAEVSWSR